MPPELEAVNEAVLGLLRRSHLLTADELANVVAEQAAVFGARDVALHLADLEQVTLVGLPASAGGEAPPTLSVAGTVAGRAYATTTSLSAPAEGGGSRLWVPLLDGTDRLGVLGLTFEEEVDHDLLLACERYAHLAAMLVATKNATSDVIERRIRRQPMTIASELARAIAPPMVFATEGLALAGMLEPAYDNGGDALDYAVNDRLLHVAVFDAMGHGLAAAGVAAFAVAAYRSSRRAGRDLLETYAVMDEAVGRQFPEQRFVTALIARLERDTGRLSFISAGHPPPMLIRGGRARELETRPVTPLGIGFSASDPTVTHASLQPGDLVLLYTDGLTEARDPEGGLLGVEGLSGFVEREAAAGQTVPETLRRLRQATLRSDRAELRDDATAVLFEWQRGGERHLLPRTAV